jgi:hypothetical protein
MGVNAVAIAHASTPNTKGEQTLVLVTGGDDQALGVVTLLLGARDNAGSAAPASSSAPHLPPSSPLLTLSVRMQRQWRLELAHGASVRAVGCAGNLVFSTGHDQRLRGWRLNLQAAMRADAPIPPTNGGPPPVSEAISGIAAVKKAAEAHAEGAEAGATGGVGEPAPLLVPVSCRCVAVQHTTALAILSVTRVSPGRSQPGATHPQADWRGEGSRRGCANTSSSSGGNDYTRVQPAQAEGAGGGEEAVVVVGGHGVETLVMRL